MSGYLSDILEFEGSNLGSMWSRLKKDPERAFIGAIDSAGSKAWGGVTGKDYSPMLDMGGGAAPGAYREAEAKGIDITAGKNMHRLARVIAAYNAGSYGLSAMGYGGGGATAANMNATNPALIDSAMGTSGYGASSAGPGGSSGLAAISPGQWAQMGQQFGKIGDQEEPPPEINGVPVMSAEEWARMQQAEGATIAQSSRKVKTPGGLASVQAGDPISENGSHIAAIQQLKREIEAARKRVAALKARKGRK